MHLLFFNTKKNRKRVREKGAVSSPDIILLVFWSTDEDNLAVRKCRHLIPFHVRKPVVLLLGSPLYLKPVVPVSLSCSSFYDSMMQRIL